jgi:formylglycine-generating enzyme required for sulfatase activity
MGKYQVQQGFLSSGTQLPLSQQEYYTIIKNSIDDTITFDTAAYPYVERININPNPSQFQANQRTRPVERVSWYDALYFCNLLSIKQGLTPVYAISNIDRAGVLGIPQPTTTLLYAITGADVAVDWSANGYRLPTEAEWEYAARGGDGSPGNFIYAGSDNADDVAWFNTNSGSMTHPSGTKAPNGLGIFDMNGNVMEWCWDWYGSQYYKEQLNSASYRDSNNIDIDPKGPDTGSERVRRGGSWNNAVNNVRSVYRASFNPASANWVNGFRVMRYPKPDELY